MDSLDLPHPTPSQQQASLGIPSQDRVTVQSPLTKRQPVKPALGRSGSCCRVLGIALDHQPQFREFSGLHGELVGDTHQITVQKFLK